MVLSLVNKFTYIPNLELNYYILEKAHRRACKVYRRECRQHPQPKTREPTDIRHPGTPVQRIRLSYRTWRDDLQCPTFTVRLYNQVASLSRDTTLKVQVSGSPVPEVHWFKDAIPINFNSTHWIKEIRKNVHVLIIKNATMKDQGVYMCRASNDAGSVTTSAFIFVQPPSVRFVPFPSIIYL